LAGDIQNEITTIDGDITRINTDIANLETEIIALRAAPWNNTISQQINIRITQQNTLRQQLQPLRDRRNVLERVERARVRRATEYTTLSTFASSFNI
jgi:predicted  nucleic acid-binding Zn-ribbon protein